MVNDINYLEHRFRMSELLIGHDHGFGRDRAGGVGTLRTLGTERGVTYQGDSPAVLGSSLFGVGGNELGLGRIAHPDRR